VDLELNDTPALAVLAARGRRSGGVSAQALQTCQDLLRVAKRSLSLFGDQFTAHGLSPVRYAVLMELYYGELRTDTAQHDAQSAGLLPSQLAERIGVTRPTITGLIDGMLREGLLLRLRADAEDGRRRGVRLSARGRQLLDELLPPLFARMSALVAPLSHAEQASLRRLLLKVERGPLLSGGARSSRDGAGDD
jgi:DNA-binding MarR family transcriptional regulator